MGEDRIGWVSYFAERGMFSQNARREHAAGNSDSPALCEIETKAVPRTLLPQDASSSAGYPGRKAWPDR